MITKTDTSALKRVCHVALCGCVFTILSSRLVMGTTVTVPNSPSLGPTGIAVPVSGTVNGASVLSFSTSDTAFLQNTCGTDCNTGTPQYGVNPSGVIVVAGQAGGPPPAVGNANLAPGSNFDYGALLVSFNSGPYIQLFPANAANGLGSTTPPTSLSFSGSLSSLFGNIGTVTNPTLTFEIEDTDYNNNAGDFALNNFNVTLASPTTVPEPASLTLLVAGVLGLGLAVRPKAA